MKVFDEKRNNPDPLSAEVTARIVEVIRSMTPEELKAFLGSRTPGVEEYWLGRPIRPARRRRDQAKRGAKKSATKVP